MGRSANSVEGGRRETYTAATVTGKHPLFQQRGCVPQHDGRKTRLLSSLFLSFSLSLLLSLFPFPCSLSAFTSPFSFSLNAPLIVKTMRASLGGLLVVLGWLTFARAGHMVVDHSETSQATYFPASAWADVELGAGVRGIRSFLP